MTSIAEIIGSDKAEELAVTHYEPSESIKIKNDKYEPYREILKNNKLLEAKIKKVFGQIDTVPAIHITSRAFRTGSIDVNSGFIGNIKENGFRARDTNVGVFMNREGLRQQATPSDFEDKPEKFLRELEVLIRHYYHHGVRTNKELLGEGKNTGVGIPVMLLIDITDIDLERGSDYEDHYKLGTRVQGNRLIGEIDLDRIGSHIRESLPEIATKFLELVEAYV